MGVSSVPRERTLVLVKPDGVQRGKVGAVIQRLERKGLQLVAMKLVRASEQRVREHYAELAAQPFFPNLVRFMTSGPLVASVWEGREVALAVRSLLGHAQGVAGALRFDLSVHRRRNVAHASHNAAAAPREIALEQLDILPMKIQLG